jgi:hypothetical protein
MKISSKVLLAGSTAFYLLSYSVMAMTTNGDESTNLIARSSAAAAPAAASTEQSSEASFSSLSFPTDKRASSGQRRRLRHVSSLRARDKRKLTQAVHNQSLARRGRASQMLSHERPVAVASSLPSSSAHNGGSQELRAFVPLDRASVSSSSSSNSSSSSSSSRNWARDERPIPGPSCAPASAAQAAMDESHTQQTDLFAGYRNPVAWTNGLASYLAESQIFPVGGVASLIREYATPCIPIPQLDEQGRLPGMGLRYEYKPKCGNSRPDVSPVLYTGAFHTFTARGAVIRCGDLDWHIDFAYEAAAQRAVPSLPEPAAPTFDPRVIVGREGAGNLCLFFPIHERAFKRSVMDFGNEQIHFTSTYDYGRVSLGFDGNGYQADRINKILIGDGSQHFDPKMAASLSFNFDLPMPMTITIGQLHHLLIDERINDGVSLDRNDFPAKKYSIFQRGGRKFRVINHLPPPTGLELLPNTVHMHFLSATDSWFIPTAIVRGLSYAEGDYIHAEPYAKAIAEGSPCIRGYFTLKEIGASVQPSAEAEGTQPRTNIGGS